MFPRAIIALCFASLGVIVLADGPQDNIAENVRPVPPPGIKIADQDRQAVTEGAATLANSAGL